MLSDSSLTEQQKAALNEMLGILNTEYTLKTEMLVLYPLPVQFLQNVLSLQAFLFLLFLTLRSNKAVVK